MDFNTILTRFGFDSSNFVNKPINTIEFENGFIYEAEEEYKSRICSDCNHPALHYRNFKRFRARVMLILTYKNQR